MNTFQLSCFLAVAETLSFARAAEQLNITQPAVTHQIHSLETELNVKLFVRTTRTVNLTQEGTLFLNDARNILALTIRATKRFENPPEQEIQMFSIGWQSQSPMFLFGLSKSCWPPPVQQCIRSFASCRSGSSTVFWRRKRWIRSSDFRSLTPEKYPDFTKSCGRSPSPVSAPGAILCLPWKP